MLLCGCSPIGPLLSATRPNIRQSVQLDGRGVFLSAATIRNLDVRPQPPSAKLATSGLMEVR